LTHGEIVGVKEGSNVGVNVGEKGVPKVEGTLLAMKNNAITKSYENIQQCTHIVLRRDGFV